MESEPLSRRRFLQVTASGTAVGASSVGVVSGQEDGEEPQDGEQGTPQGNQQPDFGGYLDGVDGGFRDARGEGEVTVSVGASGNGGSFAFEPAGVWVDSGATVVWEWTGEGGGHNVHAVSGPAEFQSDTVSEAGATFEHVFEEGGIVEYQCDPHVDLGMLGAVAVGDEVPTVSAGGGGEGGGEVDPHEMGVPFQPHFVGVATLLMLVISLVFTFFFLKYGETPHSGFPERD